MVYHSVHSSWTVGQKKSLQYYYTTNYTIKDNPGGHADTIALSLMPIGPTILVEWEE